MTDYEFVKDLYENGNSAEYGVSPFMVAYMVSILGNAR